MALTIAIDGPVGAGKSTVAGQVADALGILHLDTGAMYRAFGLKTLREGADIADEAVIGALLDVTRINVQLEDGQQRTILDGEDVTGQIRTPEVSVAASAVSTLAAVRQYMVALQQICARQSDMVVDGRDIGTRVLPDASFKFYLGGDPAVRARRRYDENIGKGIEKPYEEVLDELIQRDRQDMQRQHDPLRQAEDAILIDTTAMDIPGVVAKILETIRRAGA